MTWQRGLATVVLSIAVAIAPASAQDTRAPAADVVQNVLLDPTTYAPGVLYFTATRLDWASSQPFFQHGVLEHNPAFTISGRPDDRPLSYGAGNRVIVQAALSTVGVSAANNIAERSIERLLTRNHPEHRKLWRALGWIERIGLASYLGYQQSVLHFEQWQANERLAARRGYR